jgi:DNA polymerase III epsilon subunit-like protein
MNKLEIKHNLIKFNNINLNNLMFNNKRTLPLIKQEQQKLNSNKYLNFIDSSNTEKTPANFYKTIDPHNRPLDAFPQNSQNKRFIILNIETCIKSTKDLLNDDANQRIISVNAIEMINMELTGIQFHAYFNDDIKEANKDENENYMNMIDKNDYLFYLSNYFMERKDNNKKLLKQLLNFIGESMVICHNVLFIMKFINKELKRYNLPEIPNNKCICTLRMMRLKNFKNAKEKMKGFQISDLCKEYNIIIDEKLIHNLEINTLALSISINKMLLQEFNESKNESKKTDNDQNIKNIDNENNNISERKNDFLISDFCETANQTESNTYKRNAKLKYNKINSLRSLHDNNFTITQNNIKEFNRKIKITKSLNKYKYYYDSIEKDNIKELNDNDNNKNNFLFNNFTKTVGFNKIIFKDIMDKNRSKNEDES